MFYHQIRRCGNGLDSISGYTVGDSKDTEIWNYIDGGIISLRGEKAMEAGTYACVSDCVFKTVFVCALSDRHTWRSFGWNCGGLYWVYRSEQTFAEIVNIIVS